MLLPWQQQLHLPMLPQPAPPVQRRGQPLGRPALLGRPRAFVRHSLSALPPSPPVLHAPHLPPARPHDVQFAPASSQAAPIAPPASRGRDAPPLRCSHIPPAASHTPPSPIAPSPAAPAPVPSPPAPPATPSSAPSPPSLSPAVLGAIAARIQRPRSPAAAVRVAPHGRDSCRRWRRCAAAACRLLVPLAAACRLSAVVVQRSRGQKSGARRTRCRRRRVAARSAARGACKEVVERERRVALARRLNKG